MDPNTVELAGKTLLHWDLQTNDHCPRCASPEDTLHVLQCTAVGANITWQSLLLTLMDYTNSLPLLNV